MDTRNDMMYKDDDIDYNDYETKLDRILQWVETKPTFDDSVFVGIQDYHDNHSLFTLNQEIAIDNVYYGWKVDVWHRKNGM